MTRTWPKVVLTLLALNLILGLAIGQETKSTKPKFDELAKARLAVKEAILAERFQEFLELVVRLKTRMERSNDKADKKRAAVLAKVLKEAQNVSLQTQFEQMVKSLNQLDIKSTTKIKQSYNDAKQIADELQRLLIILKGQKELENPKTPSEIRDRLLALCKRMLVQQKYVYKGTRSIADAVAKRKPHEPTRIEAMRAIDLSVAENLIHDDAVKAINLLKGDVSAVVFPTVFLQLKQDIVNVEDRLEIIDVGKTTQRIELDIISSLEEMIEALEKAKQNEENPPPTPPTPIPPNQKPPLVDRIAELKLIRAMQRRLNRRTKVYGQQYKGEQASEPRIRKELRQLADRQMEIANVTTKLAKTDSQRSGGSPKQSIAAR